jgi:hypothetical protein
MVIWQKQKKLYLLCADFTTPHYLKNDRAHGIRHRDTVSDRAGNFSVENYPNNPKIEMMAFAAAMCHDMMHYATYDKNGRKISNDHEILSAKAFMANSEFRHFFNENQMRQVEKAILDHRASNPNEPRGPVGKIVSTADRRVNVWEYMMDVCAVAMEAYPKNERLAMMDALRYTRENYGICGKGLKKSYIADPDFEIYKATIQRLIGCVGCGRPELECGEEFSELFARMFRLTRVREINERNQKESNYHATLCGIT